MIFSASSIEKIKTSWQNLRHAAASGDDVPSRVVFSNNFYSNLRVLSEPHYDLLQNEMAMSSGMFLFMINAVIEILDTTRSQTLSIRQLGDRHRGYGVKLYMYVFNGRAFIDTLRSQMSESELALWVCFYSEIVSTMTRQALAAALLQRLVDAQTVPDNEFNTLIRQLIACPSTRQPSRRRTCCQLL